MDRIMIEDLQVYAYHGVAPAEKSNGQMFFVSLWMDVNLEKAAKSDDVKDTVSYADICADVQKVMQLKKYNLIESAAMNVIEYLFRAYPGITKIRILLKKPWAPMGHHLKFAAVELERQRSERNE